MINEEKAEFFDKLIIATFDKSKEEMSENETEFSLIFFTESIISNGGFTSFFEHSDPDTRQDIYQLYKKLGAKNSLNILLKFQKLLDSLPKDTTVSDLLDAEEVDKLDEEYWEHSDDISVLGYDYYCTI